MASRRFSPAVLPLVLACGLAAVVVIGCRRGGTYVAPTATPDLGCSADADCVIAIRLDVWCDCGHVYTREQVEDDPYLLLLPERYDYPYRRPRRTREPSGPTPACEPCEPLMGTVCVDGQCRLAQTRPELLRVCPGLPERERTWCYVRAAALALEEEGVPAAIETCASLAGPDSRGLEEQQACLEWVFYAQLGLGDATGATAFCLQSLPPARHSYCLKTAAEVLAATDLEAGVDMCAAIQVVEANDQWQQDACFGNIAVMLAGTDPDRARQLCRRVSNATDLTQDSCLRSVENSIPTATPTPTAPSSPLPTPTPTATVSPAGAGEPPSPLPSPTATRG